MVQEMEQLLEQVQAATEEEEPAGRYRYLDNHGMVFYVDPRQEYKRRFADVGIGDRVVAWSGRGYDRAEILTVKGVSTLAITTTTARGIEQRWRRDGSRWGTRSYVGPHLGLHRPVETGRPGKAARNLAVGDQIGGGSRVVGVLTCGAVEIGGKTTALDGSGWVLVLVAHPGQIAGEAVYPATLRGTDIVVLEPAKEVTDGNEG